MSSAKTDAERLAVRAEHVARAAPHRWWRMLGALAAAVAATGDETLATEVAGRIDSPGPRASALIKMVTVTLEAGGWSRARGPAAAAEAALTDISDGWDRGRQAAHLVAAVIAGELDTATRLAGTIVEPQFRVQALCALAVANGQGQKALAFAREADEIAVGIYGHSAREGAFVDVTEAYAHAGEHGHARVVADRIEDDIRRDRAKFAKVKAAVAAGDYATAEAVRRTIADGYVRDDAVAMTAELLAGDGDLESAAGLLGHLLSPSLWARAVTAIAGGAAGQGDWTTAERYLDELNDERDRSRLLVVLARAAANEGDPARARLYLRRALPDGDLETLLPAVAAVEPTTVLHLARRVTEIEP